MLCFIIVIFNVMKKLLYILLFIPFALFGQNSNGLPEVSVPIYQLFQTTNTYALIKLNTSEKVTIVSDYGKYNSENNDTIFSKNVIVNYLDNKITSEYLDFSLDKNLMLISKNVVYSNLENNLEADVVEIEIKSRDTKIFMYEKDKKVNIKSTN